MNDVQSQRPILCERLSLKDEFFRAPGGVYAPRGTNGLDSLTNGYSTSFFADVSDEERSELVTRTTNVSYGIILQLGFFTGVDYEHGYLPLPYCYRPRVMCFLTLEEFQKLGPKLFKNGVDDHLHVANRVCKLIRNGAGEVQYMLMKESHFDHGRCAYLAAIGECSFLPDTPAVSDLEEGHSLRENEYWSEPFETGFKVTALVQTVSQSSTSVGYPNSRIVVRLNDEDFSKLPVQLRAERDRIYTELTVPPPPYTEETPLVDTAARTNSFWLLRSSIRDSS